MIARPKRLSTRLILLGAVACAVVAAYFGVSSELWRFGFGTGDRYLAAPWQTKDSAHFVFHYFTGTAADYHIDAIATDEEQAFATVCAALGTAPQQPIDCYLYPSVGELYRWTRMSRPFAQGTMIHLIYETYGTVDLHEVTHVVAWDIGRPSRFLQEGLAVSVEQAVGGEPLPDWIGAMRDWDVGEGFLGDEYEQFDRRLDARGYAVAGAFVTYLRATYGQAEFLELYARDGHSTDLEAFRRTISDVYGVDFATLAGDFGRWLKEAPDTGGR